MPTDAVLGDEEGVGDGLTKDGNALNTKTSPTKTARRCGGKRSILIAVVVLLVCVLALGLSLGLALKSGQGQRLAIGAVAADHPACSRVGRDILKEGGSAVDAAIASLLCDGVRQPHSMGIGGGLIGDNTHPADSSPCAGLDSADYCRNTYKAGSIQAESEMAWKQVRVLHHDISKIAPQSGIHQRSRVRSLGSLSLDKFINKSFRQGPLSIAVPAEVMAYWDAHQKYGKLPWATLFEPAIKMARDGHPLSNSSARALQLMTKRFNVSLKAEFPQLCKSYCNERGGLKLEGDEVKLPALAKTLSGIAKHGPDYLYKGEVADRLLQEIKQFGGLVTKADFEGNLTRHERPLEYQYGDLTMYVPGAPSGGPVMGLILEILEGFNLTPADIETPAAEAATYHKIIEAFKFAYADRLKLGDPHFVQIHDLIKKMTSPAYAASLREKIDLRRTHNASHYTDITGQPWDEQGTAQINVLAPNGDAVAVCSTINYYFGSLLVSPSTGIILNNEMADFSTPNVSYLDGLKAVPPNYIEPGKQPLSSMAPAIFVDGAGDPRLIIGSSGGARISTVNAQVAVRILWLKQSVEEAVRHKRFHHQLFPDKVKWEPGFNQGVLDLLHNKYGHELQPRTTYMAVLQAIYRDPDTRQLHAFSDERKKGKASLLYGDAS
ncbi:glutathione hydrolase 1 proenzyme-like [Haliotis rubra]|uniref:glutathione hydrolase 1 proenzyme-like n=1 Tax=Haliotis rubra TaxID=36100 RepID=UPI001EE4F582|nr:glutathione hydrolase 1 proenzyme-like [Haliotis rubra]